MDRDVSESKLKEMEILLSQKQMELDEARNQLEDEKRKTILFKDSFSKQLFLFKLNLFLFVDFAF